MIAIHHILDRLLQRITKARATERARQTGDLDIDRVHGEYLSAVDTLNMASLLHGEGKRDDAERICRQVIEGNPNNADALHLLGIFVQHRGEPGKAIELLIQAAAIDPPNPLTLNNLASLLQQEGRLEEAGSCYERALECKPDFAAAYHNLGRLRQEQGRLDDALACYGQALSLDPTLVSALLGRARGSKAYGW